MKQTTGMPNKFAKSVGCIQYTYLLLFLGSLLLLLFYSGTLFLACQGMALDKKS